MFRINCPATGIFNKNLCSISLPFAVLSQSDVATTTIMTSGKSHQMFVVIALETETTMTVIVGKARFPLRFLKSSDIRGTI